MNKFFYPIALILSVTAMAVPLSHAENDINALELSQDLQKNPSNLNGNPLTKTTNGLDAENNKNLNVSNTNQELWFKVEVIIFKYANTDVTEVFPAHVNFEAPSNLIQLKGFDYPSNFQEMVTTKGLTYSSTTNDSSVTPQANQTSNGTQASTTPQTQTNLTLPGLSYQTEPLELLQSAFKRIKNSQNHEILISTAWKQPLKDKAEAPTIHLVAGDWFDNEPEFEGFLKISKQRYIHAYADLFLHRYSLQTELNFEQTKDFFDENNLDSTHQGIQHHHIQLFDLATVINDDIIEQENEQSSRYISTEVFTISEDRIMKHSKDYYYLDHPRLGALIKVTPVEKLAKEAE